MSSKPAETVTLLPEGSEQTAINTLIESLGISDYTTKVTSATALGDNYMGTLLRIRVIFKNLPNNPTFVYETENNAYILSLILKASIRNTHVRCFVPTRDSFVREAHVYENVLKAFEELQERKGINSKTEGFSQYPKIYKSCLDDLDEFLILADKKPEGYVMKRRQDLFDYAHCLVVIEQLAKYHALSFVLKKEDPQLFDTLKRPLVTSLWKRTAADVHVYAKMMRSVITKAKNALDPVEDKEVLHAYEPAGEVTMKMATNMLSAGVWEEYAIISHGDCWINNILIKYKDPDQKQINDICFLDFAVSSLTSPLIDLGHFIYTNAQQDVIQHRANDLIETYYKNLSDFIVRLGHDPEDLFPKAEFAKRLPEYFTVGVYSSTFASKVMLQDADEAVPVDSVDANSSKEELLKSFIGDTAGNAVYNRKIATVIRHAYESGFFDLNKYSKNVLDGE